MQVIAFISSKGGVGKSMLAANAAVALAQRGKKVLTIDLDPQNSLRLHLAMDPDEIAGLVREGISASSEFESPFRVKFIPFGHVCDNELDEFAKYLSAHPRWVADSIHSLHAQEFDFIILDTPPGPTVYLRQALEAANCAIAVGLADAASYASMPKMSALVEQYTAGRIDFRGLFRLINQMPVNSRLGHQVRSAIIADYAEELIPVFIHKDPRVQQALANEQPLMTYAPSAVAAIDIEHLVNWVLACVDT